MKSKLASISLLFGSLALIYIMVAACQPNLKPTQPTGGNRTALDTPKVEPGFAVKEVNFSPEQASKVAPEDIILEVGIFIGLMDIPSVCESRTRPGICYAPDEVEWLDSFSIVTSGWNYGEDVKITIFIPDGRQTVELGIAREEETVIHYGDYGEYAHYIRGDSHIYLFNYVFLPDLGLPPGKYEFVFEGESEIVKASVNICMSSTPRMRNFGETQTVLSGFVPNEHVYIYAFDQPDFVAFNQPEFKGMVEYDVGENGVLVINNSMPFCVVGESSGLVDPDGVLNCEKSISPDS